MSQSAWGVFPELLTNRLLLRKMEPADAAAIFLLRSDPLVTRFVDRPLLQSIEDGLKFIRRINISISEGDCLFWAIVPKHEEDLIGTICIWNWDENNQQAEIGFELMPAWQKQGYMMEAVIRVLEFAFVELKLHRIEAWVNPQNKRSIELLQKNGFQLSPSKVPNELNGTPSSLVIYCIEK